MVDFGRVVQGGDGAAGEITGGCPAAPGDALSLMVGSNLASEAIADYHFAKPFDA